MSGEVNVGICVPHGGTVRTAAMLTVVDTVYALGTLRVQSTLLEQAGCYIDENRNVLVRRALGEGCSHVFFVDADMRFPGAVVKALLAHGRPIVGANYHTRTMPPQATCKLLGPDGRILAGEVPAQPFAAYAVATGCLLIEAGVFARVPYPWFRKVTAEDPAADEGEDVFFCERARAVGFDIWCDPTLPVHHLGDYAY